MHCSSYVAFLSEGCGCDGVSAAVFQGEPDSEGTGGRKQIMSCPWYQVTFRERGNSDCLCLWAAWDVCLPLATEHVHTHAFKAKLCQTPGGVLRWLTQGEPVGEKTLTVAHFSQYSPIFKFGEARKITVAFWFLLTGCGRFSALTQRRPDVLYQECTSPPDHANSHFLCGWRLYPPPEMDIQLIDSLFSHVPLLTLTLTSLAPSCPSCHFRYQPELS